MGFSEFKDRFETALAEFQLGELNRVRAIRSLTKNGVLFPGQEPKQPVVALLVSAGRFGGATERLLKAGHYAAFPMACAMEKAIREQELVAT